MRKIFMIIFLLWPTIGFSQNAATLVADRVTISNDQRLIADGHVQMLYDGTRLEANRIVYDRKSDQLTIDGDILITSPDGNILTATQATLDPQFSNGVLRSARLVLGKQLQLAAQQINRRDGNTSLLYQVAATSCQVCSGEAPLWEIRAKSVFHDEVEKQLYFETVQFRIRGVPIAYLPRLRLPDPTLQRATGFLKPRAWTTDQLSYGIKLPYFVRIGDDRDLTLTPYLSDRTRTLEFRYRQAFVSGDVVINAAVSNDDLHADNRAYLFANGSFEILSDANLSFDIETASDRAYLLDYGYSSKDRLDSAITLTRVRDTSLFTGGVTIFQTLRDNEQTTQTPPFVGAFTYENHTQLSLNGNLTTFVTGDTVFRYGSQSSANSRDLNRISAGAFIDNSIVTSNGILFDTQFGLRGDIYQTLDDPLQTDVIARAIPHGAVTIRYPLAAAPMPDHHLLVTPVVSLAYSNLYGDTPLNEDSTRNELDASNLFAINRFVGEDAVEMGLRAAFGLDINWQTPNGTQSSMTLGRVLRSTENTTFGAGSGLDGRASDWVLAGQTTLPNGLQIDGLTRLDSAAHITLGTARFGWTNDQFGLSGAYIWQDAAPSEDRPTNVSEWTLDTEFQVADHWRATLSTRYDLAVNRPARASVGLEYKNECVTVDLSLSRRYTSSTTVEPSTSYGLSVSLGGFSTGQSNAGPSAECKNG